MNLPASDKHICHRLIDRILNNGSEKILKSGVIFSFRDIRPQVYTVRKHVKTDQAKQNLRFIRNFKNFSETDFMCDISQASWEFVTNTAGQHSELNVPFGGYLSPYSKKFLIDMHAPLQHRRIKSNYTHFLDHNACQKLMRTRLLQQPQRKSSYLQFQCFLGKIPTNSI